MMTGTITTTMMTRSEALAAIPRKLDDMEELYAISLGT